MYQCIKQYCESEDRNGLFLLNMPTGFGKTYSVIKYIYDFSMRKENEDRKIFFVTTLKKNLPRKELEERFEENGKLSEFKEKFLFLDSNVDTVIENFTPEVKKSIPTAIRSLDEYKKFKDDIEFLQKCKNSNDYVGYAKSVRDNFSSKNEPAFRKAIQGLLIKNFNTVKQRIYAIKTDSEWQWLGELYPAVFTSERQIIFMSMDKFLCQNSTLVERPYYFYNSSIIDDAIIFIDEFDATKETVLKNIIQNGLKDRIDYIDLFNAIYSALYTTELPNVLTKPSNQRQKSEYKNQSLQSVIDGIKEKADDIYNLYSLKYSHKTESTDEEGAKNFLFHDHRFLSILDAKKQFISTQCDKDTKVNTIQFLSEKPADKNNIQVLLGKLRGFINWFQGAVYILAVNFFQQRNEQRKPGDDEFSLEASVRSVLSLFRLGAMYENYLTSQILVSSRKTKGNIAGSEYDFSFYETGFRYYSFENAPTHALQSRIMMYSFQTTPEKLMIRFCERAKVVGISATATISTVIGNYDLEYLNAKIGNLFHLIDEKNFERLKNDFMSEQVGYSDININVELLGPDKNIKYCALSWQKVFEDEDVELAKYVFDELQQILPESIDNNNYNKKRYLRIALAYKNFIQKEDIKSFLCVLTKHPKENDKYLDINMLHKIFNVISRCYTKNYDRNSIVQLDGEEYDNKKDEITERLSKGDKLFVISVYQTIGAGQNLQYTVPKSLDKCLIRTNERKSNGKKDFDAIYLDKPTNLMVNINTNNLDEDSFVKYLFQIEFLQENAEISQLDAGKNIKAAFKAFLTAQNPMQKGITSKSIRLYSTQKIIQAIGRMCRTNLKQKNIYIFADDRISEDIDISIANRNIFNPEFIALVNKIKEQECIPIEESSLIYKAELTSNKVNKFINNMLREEWSDTRMRQWEELRTMVLKSPTLSSAEVVKDFKTSQFYIKVPNKSNELYYHQDNDYNNVQISFSRDKKYEYIVSDVAAKLNRLMTVGEIRKVFEDKGWATEFIPNDYLMSPALFNNIYKGALGEVVGWIVFTRHLHITLEKIEEPELFELFDYRAADAPVYIDFKNWHETTSFDEKEILEKVIRKAKKCDCKCVIIANILANRLYKTEVKDIEGIRIISCPSLLVDGDKISFDESALETIRRCVDEFRD